MVVKVIRTVSVLACLIVIASFAVFAINQTQDASDHQQTALNGRPVPGAPPSTVATNRTVANTTTTVATKEKQEEAHESGFHKTLDHASNAVTSPFAGIVSETDSQWIVRGVKLILALLVYGFGLSFVARYLRVTA
ncbi:MAG TPA: hypothetical protein VH025_03400 [Solirubrobacteraceae bacterium]|jgi:hypothetical protein|nr:hypothetical protein [Solirubrobacteraceae bacterium]